MAGTIPTRGRGAARFRDVGLLLAVVLLAAVTAVRSPHFATAANLQRIMLDISLLLIVATGQTMVVLTRNIDLSVGSVLGLSGIAVGFLLKDHPAMPVTGILLLGTGLGLILGAVNGALVAWGRVPAVIATLGTLTVYRGLVFIHSGGQQVNPQDIPLQLVAIARPGALGVPVMVVMAFVIAALGWLLLRYTRTGRAMYAIGSNPDAARMRGVQAGRIVFLTYLISGALAGLAGVLYAARFATVNPASAGVAFELQAVAATVIGGTSILGGRGGVPGTFLGALLLGTIANALAVSGVSGFWQRAIEGAIILAAVAVDSLIRQHSFKEGARRV
ncbi:MAG: ABC transporter permease [Firmicutes bacterium]|nr:ABC transporter permease [Bacillota bacterium]